MTGRLVDCPLCGGDGRLCVFDMGGPELVPCEVCQGSKKLPEPAAKSLAAQMAAMKAKRPPERSKYIKEWPTV